VANALAIDAAAVADLGAESCMFVPVFVRKQPVAVITFVATTRRRFGPEDLETAQDLAARIGFALDSAEQHRAAQRAIRAREDLLAVVSHDLRAPLTTVTLAARALGGGDARSEMGTLPNTILRAAERMERLIGDLLDIAEIDAGQLRIERRENDVGEIVSEVVDGFRALADKRHIALEMQVRGELRISCDRDRVAQILANLLNNALKFTPSGGSVLACVEADGDDVRFAVSDTGRGIAADDLPNIWRRFWRCERTAGGGVGIGLNIVKHLVEVHGGAVSVDSKHGFGATFTFSLPRNDRASKPNASNGTMSSSSTSSSSA
jgi:signal transduction histidine kinase